MYRFVAQRRTHKQHHLSNVAPALTGDDLKPKKNKHHSHGHVSLCPLTVATIKLVILCVLYALAFSQVMTAIYLKTDEGYFTQDNRSTLQRRGAGDNGQRQIHGFADVLGERVAADLLKDANALTDSKKEKKTRVKSFNGKEYVMWSPEESYFNECRRTFLNNITWGEPLKLYVEKVFAKHIVKAWSPSIKLVPTLAFYDQSNISEFDLGAMKRLPQPYIIKPAHSWGGIAGVQQNTYNCFRGCFTIRDKLSGPAPLDEKTAELAQKQMRKDLTRDHSVAHGEMQYFNVTPRILVEAQLDLVQAKDVTKWYMVNGQPIYISMECPDKVDRNSGRAMYTADFRQLPVRRHKPPCQGKWTEKPKTWDLMRKIAVEIGSHLMGYVTRVDLYSDDIKGEVYFSELTFTTGGCLEGAHDFHPHVADGLLYAVLHEEVPSSVATPDFVERTINNKSWVLITHKVNASSVKAYSYPSPVDLCESSKLNGGFKLSLLSESDMGLLKNRCYEEARRIQSFPLRCFSLITVPGVSGILSSAGASTFHEDDERMNALECTNALSTHGVPN